ncbi:MerR family transcriptional regulator [Dehalobacterium formicoaceticum]|uniref:Helix-turn-helix domain-containing protein n=1 Tax=Dehalobacterium formicoaceticum TaxID=51515 RepID=A0ABT1YAM7_9FIRM|nr:helix-turn-helix domain-containing protein [Dehalobacterium formicoaceticum]MCR6546984.1 helix-turn-helix domain-containing protein [Dehalobacterium formicoaceticum]
MEKTDKSMNETIKETTNQMMDQTMIMGERLINTKTACKILGVSSRTLRRWCKDGFLPYFNTVGGHKRFSLKEIKKFLANNHVNSDT